MSAEKILIVEDNAPLRLGLRQLLERSRFVVVESATGTEALTLAEQHQPHLILLDLGLPDGDGVWVAQELKRRQTTRRIPIAILTGEPVHGPRAKILGQISAGTIPKPFTPERLERDIAILLRMGRRGARKFPRYAVEIPAWYHVRVEEAMKEDLDAEYQLGLVKTISQGGVMLELPRDVPAKTCLDLRLLNPGGEIVAVGRIVYSRFSPAEGSDRDVFQHGIQFLLIGSEELLALKDLIREREKARGPRSTPAAHP
jgi:CheY-like chemotaxis protein